MANWLLVIIGIVMLFGVITHNVITDGKLEPSLDRLGYDDLVKLSLFIFGIIIILIGFAYKVSRSKNNPSSNDT